MAKTRGRGVLKGAIGYPGPKQVTTQNLTADVLADLKANEKRLGVSKTALVIFALRKIKLHRFSLADIVEDIEAAEWRCQQDVLKTRAKRWKSQF